MVYDSSSSILFFRTFEQFYPSFDLRISANRILASSFLSLLKLAQLVCMYNILVSVSIIFWISRLYDDIFPTYPFLFPFQPADPLGFFFSNLLKNETAFLGSCSLCWVGLVIDIQVVSQYDSDSSLKIMWPGEHYPDVLPVLAGYSILHISVVVFHYFLPKYSWQTWILMLAS